MTGIEAVSGARAGAKLTLWPELSTVASLSVLCFRFIRLVIRGAGPRLERALSSMARTDAR